MNRLPNIVFFISFLLPLTLILFFQEKLLSNFFSEVISQEFDSDKRKGVELYKLKKANGAVEVSSREIAKRGQLFWVSNIEGKGWWFDLKNSKRALEALFPGYREHIEKDPEFWREYFNNIFASGSFLSSNKEISNMGFRVTYSWTGCFSLYKRYGAEVLVLGSSEVYFGLVPGQLADQLERSFGYRPKVLFCVSPAMSVEAVRLTIQELMSLRQERPKIVIWGYSFWLAYEKTEKFLSLKESQLKQFYAYKTTQISHLQSFFDLFRDPELRPINYLPHLGWDDVLGFSMAKFLSIRASIHGSASREGMYIDKKLVEQDDAKLSGDLKASLIPFYALSAGVSQLDCDMRVAKDVLGNAIKDLGAFSSHVIVYIPPTTLHHRNSVPACFIPNVKMMLRKVSKPEGVHVLLLDTESWNLSNRDFIHHTLDPDKRYFDINHVNYVGAQKITKKIGDFAASFVHAEK